MAHLYQDVSDCNHVGCLAYNTCRVPEEAAIRENFWMRHRMGVGSIRDLGTDPLIALDGNRDGD
jgi:hypothetical protein